MDTTVEPEYMVLVWRNLQVPQHSHCMLLVWGDLWTPQICTRKPVGTTAGQEYSISLERPISMPEKQGVVLVWEGW